MIYVLEILVAILTGGIVAWIVWDAVQRYTTLPGNIPTWERLAHAFSDSATITVMRIGQLITAVMATASSYGVLFQDSNIQQMLSTNLGPRWMQYLFLFFTIAGEVARRRTL